MNKKDIPELIEALRSIPHEEKGYVIFPGIMTNPRTTASKYYQRVLRRFNII